MRFRILIFLGILSTAAVAQEIPLGTWRTHFSYDRVLIIEETPGYIFASSDVGLFSVHKPTGEVQKYSTLDGLQDVDISALAYDQVSGSLYIGYRSGNLDILSADGINNLDLVSNAQIIGSKTINAIQFSGLRAFLATDYGMLDFDMGDQQVRATYRELGEEAAQVAVRDIAIRADSLFVTTENGWQAIAAEGVQMADYRNWKRHNVPGGLIHAESRGEQLFFQSQDTVYSYDGILFRAIAEDGNYRGIQIADEQLLIFNSDEILYTDFNGVVNETVTDEAFTMINALLVGQDGLTWVADGSSGLLRGTNSAWESFSPSGPVRSDMFRLSENGALLLAATGGYNANVSPLGEEGSYSVFEGGQWRNYEVMNFPDISDGVILDGQLFLASAGGGITQVGENGTVRYNQTNSPLQANIAGQVLVTDLAVHRSELYAINHDSSTPLLRFNGQQWEAFSNLPAVGRYAEEGAFAGPVAWMRVLRSRGGGVIGYNTETGEARYLGEQSDQGSLASRNVYDLETDRDGFLWFGTERGVSIIFNPTRLDGAINAVEPVFEGRPLLVDREVYAIATDGGNRKWMGTDQGVWLFDALADQLIAHFTTANSPLPSDVVHDIAINPVSGEVFFLTAQGIASFRSDASSAEREHSNVKIFPNPVQRTFQGTVGISGLTTDANVKITDITGRLVYQTRANGGTATWPVRSTGGIHTGIYLVFSTSGDGEENYIGKIAIIN